MKKITIEKVDNGFIVSVDKPYGFEQLVFSGLFPVLEIIVDRLGEPGDKVTLAHPERDEELA